MVSKSKIQTIHQNTYPAISPTRPELSTKGKSALISGGASGIGAAITQSFAQSGITNLAILGRTEKSLLEKKTQVELISPATTVWIYVVDVANAKATLSAVQSFAASINGKIDILIANAGYMSSLNSVSDSDPEDWWLGFETTVRGNFNLLQAFHGFASQQATVIHISSSAIHLPYMEGYSSYRSSKLAAYKLFEYYHEENPSFTVVHIHPGLISGTAMTEKFGPSVEKFGLVYDDVTLSGDFTVWAASEEAQFLNGRLVWATWDANELKTMKDEIKADKARFTMGFFT
ncbi:hypothetical protein B0J13DRAFT_666553 [Dactylonectria estremocensis]|uniref:Uncharacterized protein n=1 Tax=Dactylonectria estremocensis TaxID=1079267 RepID=A0A9P9J3P8_9HYPO|nr:hypothetical protein B0J13DRAFT_666553 [Dactylonectria estremocensis]